MSTDIVVHPGAEQLAAATADRLIGVIAQALDAGRSPAIVLTGGGTGIAVLAAVAADPKAVGLAWDQVEVFWGDERFVPVDDPDRNEKQARDSFLRQVPLDPHRVHPMAAADGEFGDDPDAAAAAYATLLPDRFDVVMLGMGPEGHVASVFPDSPAVHDHDHRVVAVRDCPKPPPTRISLTLPTIRTADQVWIMTTGDGKAEAVARAVARAAEVDLPVAGATGTAATLFLLDTAAASQLPAGTATTTG